MKATPHVYVSDRVSRRDFLKLSSLVAGMGGVMVLSGCGPAAQDATTDDAADADAAAADGVDIFARERILGNVEITTNTPADDWRFHGYFNG